MLLTILNQRVSNLVIYGLWPRTKCGALALQRHDVCRLCVAPSKPRGRGLETSLNAMHFWRSGFKFAFGKNKKGKVFGILSQLKKISKSNDVHAQNKTFLSSM